MERLKIPAEIPDAKHVHRKVAVVLQLAACIAKRQHNRPVMPDKDKDFVVQVQLPPVRAGAERGEEKGGQ